MLIQTRSWPEESQLEDFRTKIAASAERGGSKAQAARLFDVNLSSVKRYSRAVSASEYPYLQEGRPEDPNDRRARRDAPRVPSTKTVRGKHPVYVLTLDQ
jgi:hypothetical protein